MLASIGILVAAATLIVLVWVNALRSADAERTQLLAWVATSVIMAAAALALRVVWTWVRRAVSARSSIESAP
jgi:hypothetical protein